MPCRRNRGIIQGIKERKRVINLDKLKHLFSKRKIKTVAIISDSVIAAGVRVLFPIHHNAVLGESDRNGWIRETCVSFGDNLLEADRR